jgi:beta-glucanase (GH16 family)
MSVSILAVSWEIPFANKALQLCLIYEDDFKTFNTDVWSHEVQIDGFGNGAFDWTTTDEKNSYVDAEGLHIVPTLTNETTSITPDQMWANYTLNIGNQQGGDGTCTSSSNSSCFIRSNPEKGAMIPPVRSARLTTKGKKSIRYGQVEVVAKMPKGDWLWPAIWMMPEESVYGDWPRSGEIDIAESRGNDVKYAGGGRNLYYGTTHWGKTAIVILLNLRNTDNQQQAPLRRPTPTGVPPR